MQHRVDSDTCYMYNTVQGVYMTLYELSTKNETSYGVCMLLAERDRHRNEPLKVSRFAGKVREYMVKFNLGAFSMADLYGTMDDLAKLGWVKVVKHKRTGKAEYVEFLKPINTFDKELVESGRAVEPAPQVERVLKSAEVPKGLPTRFTFVLSHGQVTMEIKGDVKTVMQELREII